MVRPNQAAETQHREYERQRQQAASEAAASEQALRTQLRELEAQLHTLQVCSADNSPSPSSRRNQSLIVRLTYSSAAIQDDRQVASTAARDMEQRLESEHTQALEVIYQLFLGKPTANLSVMICVSTSIVGLVCWPGNDRGAEEPALPAA
eukprot:COSAG05_NODE_334_length_11233_cov_697.826477_3_plen_150_part_00